MPFPPYDFSDCIYEYCSNPLPRSDTSAGLIPIGQGHLSERKTYTSASMVPRAPTELHVGASLGTYLGLEGPHIHLKFSTCQTELKTYSLPVLPTGTPSQSVELPLTQSSRLNLKAPLAATPQPFTNVFWWLRPDDAPSEMALLLFFPSTFSTTAVVWIFIIFSRAASPISSPATFSTHHISGSPQWRHRSCPHAFVHDHSSLSPLTTSQTPPRPPRPSLLPSLAVQCWSSPSFGHCAIRVLSLWTGLSPLRVRDCTFHNHLCWGPCRVLVCRC